MTTPHFTSDNSTAFAQVIEWFTSTVEDIGSAAVVDLDIGSSNERELEKAVVCWSDSWRVAPEMTSR